MDWITKIIKALVETRFTGNIRINIKDGVIKNVNKEECLFNE